MLNKQNKMGVSFCASHLSVEGVHTDRGNNLFAEALEKLSSNKQQKEETTEMNLMNLHILPAAISNASFFMGKGEAMQSPPCWDAKWIFPYEVWGGNEVATDSHPQLLECNCAQGQAAAASCT